MALSARFFEGKKSRAWDLLMPHLEIVGPPSGYDSNVAASVRDHYRSADHSPDSEQASAALVSYLHAAFSSAEIVKLSPESPLAVSYFLTGFFSQVVNSLDSIALWLAQACNILQSSRSRPSLTGDDFLARLALIDATAQSRLKRGKSWMEEAKAYRWHARSRNSFLWSNESGVVVISPTTIQETQSSQLGVTSQRSTKPAPATELCERYLSQLSEILRLVFETGAPKLIDKT